MTNAGQTRNGIVGGEDDFATAGRRWLARTFGVARSFAPFAASLARALGRPPEPCVVTVAMASVLAFLTPIGHHGNLLVYGPRGGIDSGTL